MKKLCVFVFLFVLCLPLCFAQSTALKGEWKTKQYHKDTLLFVHEGYSYSDSSPERNEEYTDTTYYWNFLSNDSLAIEYAIRSCKLAPVGSLQPRVVVLNGDPEYYSAKKFPGGKKEAKEIERLLSGQAEVSSSKEKRKKHKGKSTVAEDSTTQTMQIRLSLWSAESGHWSIAKDTLTIIQTKSFNGTYRLVPISANKMMLIKLD